MQLPVSGGGLQELRSRRLTHTKSQRHKASTVVPSVSKPRWRTKSFLTTKHAKAGSTLRVL